MKLRKIGALLLGTTMIGAAMASATTAIDIPAKSWWIDPLKGTPNVVIAVGAQASSSDVVSASIIAAAVGNMATVEETAPILRTSQVEWENVGEYDYTYPFYRVNYNATPVCVDGRYLEATWYVDYDLYSKMYWETAENNWPHKDYDTYVQIAMPEKVMNPNMVVAKGLSRLWFSNSPKQWNSEKKVYNFLVSSNTGSSKPYFLVNTKTNFAVDPTFPIVRELPQYAGGSYDNGDEGWSFNYAMFTTNAWVDVQGNNNAYDTQNECDYIFGGTGTAMEAHEEIQLIVGDKYESDHGPDGIADFIGGKGSTSGIVYRTAEIRYPLLENGQNICGIQKCWGMIDFETARAGYLNEIRFLGKMYKPMFAGATYVTGPEPGYLGAYFMYGTPFAEIEKIMKVGDTYTFHGWNIILNDINIYENKAFITVSGPALSVPSTFIMVMDPLDGCLPCCPDCATYGGGGSFTSNPTQRNEYDPYVVKITVSKEKNGYTYDFFRYVNFMLDGIKTFVGADGTNLAEFNLYAIEDYGYLEDKGCCDPFVTTPNDYGLAITGGWRRVAISLTEFTPSGTEWKRIEDAQGNLNGFVSAWESAPELDSTDEYISRAYILWQPAPKCDTPCPDANFDTLELQLCDNIIIPNCETTYTVNGPENYFTVEVVDSDYGRYNTGLPFDPSTLTTGVSLKVNKAPSDQVDPYSLADARYYQYLNYFTPYLGQAVRTDETPDSDGVFLRIKMSSIRETVTYNAKVQIDPVELIKLDIEVNTDTNTKNLVLVGGPVYNSIVKDLVGMGASTVDWSTSRGEWEWLADPMAKGYDVLIVAGANREETRLAAQDLVKMFELY
ncbi:MAG TPA: S-layer protein [Methanofastidiosum sp.]|nr:S-layer protein [Methanofastidiosum sp.]